MILYNISGGAHLLRQDGHAHPQPDAARHDICYIYIIMLYCIIMQCNISGGAYFLRQDGHTHPQPDAIPPLQRRRRAIPQPASGYICVYIQVNLH